MMGKVQMKNWQDEVKQVTHDIHEGMLEFIRLFSSTAVCLIRFLCP